MDERGTIYRFGDYELCAQTRELLHNGIPVMMQERIFCLLTYLVKNSHRVVSKSELAATVWENRPISETVIPRAVMKARRAIGDDSAPPAVIRTIRGYGYRFMKTPEVVACPEPEQESEPTTADAITDSGRPGTRTARRRIGERPRRTPGYRATLWAFVVVLLMAGILVGQYWHPGGYGGKRGSAMGEAQPGVAALELSPGASSTEPLQAMTSRVTALLAHKLSNVPWIDIIHFSEENQPVADGRDRRLCKLAFSVTESSGIYRIEYTLSMPDRKPISGALTDTDPGLVADELVTVVAGFTEKHLGY